MTDFSGSGVSPRCQSSDFGIDEPPDKAEIEAIAEKSIAWWAILHLSGVLG